MTTDAADPAELRVDDLLDRYMARLMTQAFEMLAVSTAYIVGQIDDTDLAYAGLSKEDIDGVIVRAATYSKQVLASAVELNVTLADAWRDDWNEAQHGR